MFKTGGVGPIDVLREHLSVNGASFSGSPTSDFFPELARIDGMPARLTHTHDSTDYPNGGPTSDSWQVRLRGKTAGGMT